MEKSRQGASTGTGFVVPDNDESPIRADDKTGNDGDGGFSFALGWRQRLLTNLHVVHDVTDIRAQKHGNARRWRAEVVCKAADVDMAVLEIISDDGNKIRDFWGEDKKEAETDAGAVNGRNGVSLTATIATSTITTDATPVSPNQ